jgi:YfiH family protein
MLQASSFAGLIGIRHGFFTRDIEVPDAKHTSGSKSNEVAKCYSRVAPLLGVTSDRFIITRQIHSSEVVIAETPWTPDRAPHADAIVTRVPGLAIGVITADCAPVLFADLSAGIVAAAHAGWKGTLFGILESTIAAMVSLGAARPRIGVALGPTIRQPNYEVGPEFVSRFLSHDRDSARFFLPPQREGHALFDLPGYIVRRLRMAGVAQIEDIGHCNYADELRFYSYRRAAHRGELLGGRHINVITLQPETSQRYD